ncbi:MAG: response regulator [Phycisphaerales bacterium]
MKESPHPVLIIEDSPEDFEATCRALRRAGVVNPIYRCQDGDELMDYLKRRGRFAEASSAPVPGLILLDLNLPGTDGREALGTIKSDERFKSVPVVVLTTSSDERDIEGCYRAGANSYIQKPVDMERYMRLIRILAEYWLDSVILPNGGGR